ncbi:hypothetical protein NDU88_002774 [Pleurodeles waltl]|uniref:Uncharacterized protein n=1 Tax=Pleurodeles waltl TaxID=8319 RepID=A0AAV7TNK5_PLEWA|nr:hypothetical protein NDU88_002774 [Pleurodeles waltl]
MGLCDVWRFLHGQERGYSYYSAVHDMHSRLDYFLTTADMLPRIQMIEYRAKGIIDHAQLQMAVSMGPDRQEKNVACKRGEVYLRKWRRYSSPDTVGKERLPDRRTCPQGYNASLSAQSCEEEVRPRQGACAPKLKRCYAAEAELGVVLGLNQYRYCRGGALHSRHHAIR